VLPSITKCWAEINFLPSLPKFNNYFIKRNYFGIFGKIWIVVQQYIVRRRTDIAGGKLEPIHKQKLSNPKMFERLVVKATAELKNKTWGNGAVPHGVTPEDIALDCIEDLFTERKPWDTIRYPEPYPVLAGMVKGCVANLVRSGRNRLSCPWPAEQDEPCSEDQHEDYLQIRRIEAEVAHDAEMLRYVKAAQTYDKPMQIAEDLGITVKDVGNIKKRVRRVFEGRAEEFGIYIGTTEEKK
jgi:hypothetical protein